MKKNSMIFLLIFVLLLMNKPVYAETQNSMTEPTIYGQYGAVINANTGELIWGKNPHEHAYPASITKILTSILLEEKAKDGQVLTASQFAANQDASNSYFRLSMGEKITKENALKAMLLLSCNDVAMTIAENVGGSEQGFANLMNEKAKEIGANDSNFVTPNGLHNPNHYTTAYDMALITREAIKNRVILKTIGTKTATVTTDRQTKEVTNPSKIHEQPYVMGGKTGYTTEAQNTLVEVLQKDNKRIIAVTMHSTKAEEYNDINKMADYAFNLLTTQEVIHKNDILLTTKVSGEKVDLMASETYELTYVIGKQPKVEKEVSVTLKNKKNLKIGQKVGLLKVKVNGEVVKEMPLLSDKNVIHATSTNSFKFIYVILFAIIGYGVYIVHYNIQMRKKERKKMNKNKYAI